jgi:hypothetical protein
MPSYDPREFLDQLSRDALVEPADLTVYGPVADDPEDETVLRIALSRPYDRWLRVPLSLIAAVNYARNVSCGDHTHPFVRLSLRRPAADNVEALVFAQLFAHSSAPRASTVAALSTLAPAASGGDCETFTFDDVPYACCPPASGQGPWDCTILL